MPKVKVADSLWGDSEASGAQGTDKQVAYGPDFSAQSASLLASASRISEIAHAPASLYTSASSRSDGPWSKLITEHRPALGSQS